MASIPGAQLNITGASGSLGLLSPKSSWRAYVFNRGGSAASDSVGTLITFDSAAVASRFAANNWIQVGTDTSKIRKVSAVGGNSLSVSGSAVTVTTNDRIFLIGNTQPTVSGGSATYIIPSSTIRQRDDDSATIYTNSMVTSNSDGLIQFWSDPSLYDVLIQDSNQSNQGSIIDLPVGSVEGISTGTASIFGATVTFLAGVSMNATLVVGQTTTFRGNITGTAGTIALIGSLIATSNVTAGGALASTGNCTVGGLLDAQGRAVFGSTATFNTNIGVTGTAIFGGTITGVSATFTGTIYHRRITDTQGLSFVAAGISLSDSWGTGAVTSASTIGTDQHGAIVVVSGTTAFGTSAVATLTFSTPYKSPGPDIVTSRSGAGDQFTIPVSVTAVGTTSVSFRFMGTPTASTTYAWTFIAFSRMG